MKRHVMFSQEGKGRIQTRNVRKQARLTLCVVAAIVSAFPGSFSLQALFFLLQHLQLLLSAQFLAVLLYICKPQCL